MSDFKKSVDRDQAPHGWIGVSPIEKDKKGKEHSLYKDSMPKSKSFLIVSIATYLKKILGSFFSKSQADSTWLDKQQLLEDLIAFRKMLQILSNEDQSHNPEFTQQFSELWHNLLDDSALGTTTSKEIPPEAVKINRFIEKVCHFPSSEDHSLGYYLTKYVGNQWLPFPFMDILHQLHQEYQENAEASHLFGWITNLNEIISSLDLKADLNN